MLSDLRIKSDLRTANPNLRNIIPSKDGLTQNIKRAAFQAGWLWQECHVNPVYPLITEWGMSL